jgi:fructokinase
MIVGIGELLWDVFPDGRKVAGGAPFNFAFHCRQLGHAATIVSRVGDDDLGRELREEVCRLGLPDEFVQTDRKHKTGAARVTFDAAGQPSYTFVSDPAWHHLEWTPTVADLTRKAVAVCHGTLALRPRATGNLIRKMSLRIGQRGGLTVYDLNLRGDFTWMDVDERAAFGSRWLKVNEGELGPLMERVGEGIDDGVPVKDERDMIDWLRKDTKRGDTVLIVTKGASGAEVFTLSEHHRERGVPAAVVDPVGAGDAFTAAMVCLHLEGRPLRECARFANHYAARVCEHRGATPRIARAEVERAAFGA